MWKATRRATLAALVTTVLSTAWAAAGDGWIRLGGAYWQPYGDERSFARIEERPQRPFRDTLVESTALNADGNVAPLLAIEYRPNDDLGFELAVSSSTQRVSLVEGTERFVNRPGTPTDGDLISSEFASRKSDLDFISGTLVLNLYLDRRESFDLFLGPLVGFTMYDDLEVPVPDEGSPEGKANGSVETFAVDDDFVFGAVVGIGFPVSERWEFRSSARWIKSSVDVEDFPTAGEVRTVELDVNPVTFDFSFGLKF